MTAAQRKAARHRSILAAQAASAAALDLLQHVRDGGDGRFGGDVIGNLAEALAFAIEVERDAVAGKGDLHPLIAEEMSEHAQLLAAIRKWEGRI